jgi:hypothetical protein
VEDLVYSRRRSALDFTSTGVVSFSFTRLRVAEWLSRRLYITIGGILVLLSGDFGGILVCCLKGEQTDWARGMRLRFHCTLLVGPISI